jgi:hypothetical protein
LLATDRSLRSRCQARDQKGSLTLPAKKLYEIIKALPKRTCGSRTCQAKVAADRFDSRMQTRFAGFSDAA